MIGLLLAWLALSGVLTYVLDRNLGRTKLAPDTHETGTHTAPSTNSLPPKPSLYCSTCRVSFSGNENPPYAVIHVLGDPPIHLHPITKEVLDEDAEWNPAGADRPGFDVQ